MMPNPLIKEQVQIKRHSWIKELFLNKNFTLIWASNVISSFCFSVYLLMESWYVIHYLDAKSWLGIVLMATTVPRILLMVIGGVFSDRWKRETILFSSLFIRGALLLIMSMLLFLHQLDIYLLLFFSLLFGILDAFFIPANQSLLPHVLLKRQLFRGNSILQGSTQLILIIGPIVGGLMLENLSYTLITSIVAVFLLLTSIIIRFIKLNIDIDIDNVLKSSMIGSLKEGFIYIKSSRILLTLMCSSLILNFFIAGPGSMAIPLIATDVLHGTAIHLSILESAIAIGMITGIFLIGLINPTKKRGVIVLGQLFLLGSIMVFLSFTTQLWQSAVAFVLLGIGITAGDIPVRTMIQEKTDPEMMGRVTAMMSTVSNGFVPVSYGLTSLMLSYSLPINKILFCSGCLVLFFFILMVSVSKTLRKTE